MKVFCGVIEVLSLLIVVQSIRIFQLTVIDWYVLAIPTIIGCLIFLAAFYKFFNNRGNSKWRSVFTCLLCGGCLGHFSFMYLNQLFISKDIYSGDFNIVRVGELPAGKRLTKGQLYAMVDINGLEKHIMFSRLEMEEEKDYSIVHLELSRGLFGYDVIQKKELK